jgi:DNA polymerase/3'-5' exonuclease PolX
MLLTEKKLNIILGNMRISIPAELEKELLDRYGIFATDDEGHIFEYTEQDIYEQLRKKLRPYENSYKSSNS